MKRIISDRGIDQSFLKHNAPNLAIYITLLVFICWGGRVLFDWTWSSQIIPTCIVVCSFFVLSSLQEHRTKGAWRQLPLNHRIRVGLALAAYLLLYQASGVEISRFLSTQGQEIYATYYWATAIAVLLATLGFSVSGIPDNGHSRSIIRRIFMALLIIMGVSSGPIGQGWFLTSTAWRPDSVVAWVIFAAPGLLFYLEVFPFRSWRTFISHSNPT